MSSFNNMDKVPVKISENYKPPPRVYQLPQAIANKLQLPENYYQEAPQYYYDFQLERKVLAKMPEWRHMRQQARETRRKRKEVREQERIHLLEAQHKQMLGAVRYPSTEELSSSESDSGEVEHAYKSTLSSDRSAEVVLEPIRATIPAQTGDFHNILQPTILSSNADTRQSIVNTINAGDCVKLGLVSKVAGVIKEVNTFNYKDFEEDTSSPFDNIELKTINDLDILAQVLHNTQLNARAKQLDADREKSKESSVGEREAKENTHNIGEDSAVEKVDNLNTAAVSLDVENTRAALQRVDFDNLSHDAWQIENIPNITTTLQGTGTGSASNNYNYHSPTSYATQLNHSIAQQQTRQQQVYMMPYNQMYNGIVEQQPQQSLQQQQFLNFNLHTAAYSNQNYLYAPECNGITSAYSNPGHLKDTSYVGHNANNYLRPLPGVNGQQQQHQSVHQLGTNESSDSGIKSKSVPNILKELSDEVRNSELRRSRYYSCNSDEGKLGEHHEQDDEDTTPKQSPNKSASKRVATNYYANLPDPEQRLAKDISSMGFPLERVAMIAQIFGANDKKIIEHLIPLSELMDLGFEETEISAALVKFDNNKEKALEYLIS